MTPKWDISFDICIIAKDEVWQWGRAADVAQCVKAAGGRRRKCSLGGINRLEGEQEGEHCLLLVGFQLLKFLGHVFGFAAVATDGVEQVKGGAVVHQAGV
jgi:hypothetical protein